MFNVEHIIGKHWSSPPPSLHLTIVSLGRLPPGAICHLLFRILHKQHTQTVQILHLSSSSLSLIHHPHVHAHAKKAICFLCQLQTRWWHGAHPPTVAARSCFPISFICHCSFPSSGGCLSQLVNWFIMLSFLQVGWRMGGSWREGDVYRVSVKR